MRRSTRASLAILTLLGLSAPSRPARADDGPALDPAVTARRKFQDDRFGLFVHWGVYSLLGKGEWVMENDKLPVGEYEKLPARFNPAEFDADAWVKAAKDAGMNSLTVTAKHHDGFCMFDTKLTRYDVVDATPYARDPLKALADACRKQGVTLFFAYSLLDWHHPDYVPLGRTGKHAARESKGDWSKYVAYYQGQVRELCTNYGPIGGIWFEGVWDKPDAAWDLDRAYKLIHSLQPGALGGNNHHAAPKPGEDFQVSQRVEPAALNKPEPDSSVLSAELQSLNTSWGYTARDHDYKSAEGLIRMLVLASGRNANLVLNVGPKPDGTIPREALDRLAEVGRWLEKNGVSIYGTRQGPLPRQPWGVSTEKAGETRPTTIYLHVLDKAFPVSLPREILSFDACILGKTTPLKMTPRGGRVVVAIPDAERSPVDTVVVLTPKVLDREQAVR
jgi:alpha-L-fucosidase